MLDVFALFFVLELIFSSFFLQIKVLLSFDGISCIRRSLKEFFDGLNAFVLFFIPFSTQVRVVYDQDGKSRGYGFIEFERGPVPASIRSVPTPRPPLPHRIDG